MSPLEQAWFPTSTVSDALDRVGCPGVIAGLRAVTPLPGRMSGRAQPARIVPCDRPGLPGLSELLESVGEGDVIVMEWLGDMPASTLGGNAARRAVARGCAGAVVDGWVRDLDELAELGLAVWARDSTPKTGSGRLAIEPAPEGVSINGVSISRGDLVVGDTTGICVVPQVVEAEVFQAARLLQEHDDLVSHALRHGMTFHEARHRPSGT